MKIKADAKWLYEKEPIGPIFPPAGKIVIEDDIEYIKVPKEKIKSSILYDI